MQHPAHSRHSINGGRGCSGFAIVPANVVVVLALCQVLMKCSYYCD